jgi:hypothetical protein
MDKIFLINDGTFPIPIFIPVPGMDIERIKSKLPVGYIETTTDQIPQSREFRNAWKREGESVIVDMPAASEIHMNRIREVRDKKLAELDIEYMRADEVNDGQLKAQLASQKQALRDLPETFNLSVATTPEELSAMWPEGLNREGF